MSDQALERPDDLAGTATAPARCRKRVLSSAALLALGRYSYG